MVESLRPFIMSAYNAPVSLWVRESSWAFATLEVVHLFGLTMLLGSVLMLSLRSFGLTMRKHSIGQVARDLEMYLDVQVAAHCFQNCCAHNFLRLCIHRTRAITGAKTSIALALMT